MVDPSLYEEIPENPFGIQAGCILLATSTPIVAGGGTSLQFIHEQGGDDDTFIFMFGLRPMFTPAGQRVDILEGVFLTPRGPGFHPTWGFDQLMRETELGGWRVIATADVVERWAPKVEERMNR